MHVAFINKSLTYHKTVKERKQDEIERILNGISFRFAYYKHYLRTFICGASKSLRKAKKYFTIKIKIFIYQ